MSRSPDNMRSACNLSHLDVLVPPTSWSHTHTHTKSAEKQMKLENLSLVGRLCRTRERHSQEHSLARSQVECGCKRTVFVRFHANAREFTVKSCGAVICMRPAAADPESTSTQVVCVCVCVCCGRIASSFACGSEGGRRR